ncbi:hypothetical protein N7448_004159 [Penicillium atrosanguineum]|uniref:Uncharacterized protein n=1 Tax=Penicillium atrosanguineum TaxID=1132637 RepID=A0A9W9HAK8_9EURO|nr:Glyoxalase/fosfomycin resistance/dioxygenase [Penicillium atrosanguineum]KAJ5117217.1 hypothetical protein N7526_011326 [Penicillium atrosanguineum]KAJ5140751.1 hypothetical protein N7448_004159 [Penicillium atrosanguineum]KAJ5310663.1 Glyoxalase/fosfomycin resistance/dioxygenase [Penicillium atrosanguineum]KAJ5316186.1 hypothetical protein N7476_006493 [Penicillium atrosanguineum]
MSPRTIYLISSRNTEAQRSHFAIFVPAAEQPDRGSLIQAVGAPMTGYILELKRNYSPKDDSTEKYTMIEIGHVDSINIVDSSSKVKESDGVPQGNIETVASQIPTPGISDNFLAPVNDMTNKRCQEWTMEYIRHLVGKRLIEPEAIQIVQSWRDPPTHAIGFQPTVRR